MTAPSPLPPRCDDRLVWIDKLPHRTCDCHWMTVLPTFSYRPLRVVNR